MEAFKPACAPKMSRQSQQSFDDAAFRAGLQLLGAAASQSPVLRPYLPLRLVSSGGFVSVTYFRNRTSTEDLDFFLSRTQLGAHYDSVRTEFLKLVRFVASQLNYNDLWANDQMLLFLDAFDDTDRVFIESVEQGVTLYQDDALVIYAIKWEWVLARKLKRLQMEGQTPRSEDWKDCVSVTRTLYDANGGKLSPNVLQLYDHPERESPVFPQTVMNLGKAVKTAYGLDALPVAFWMYPVSDNVNICYRWEDGSMVAPGCSPLRQGTVNVWLTDQRRRRQYNFEVAEWGEYLS